MKLTEKLTNIWNTGAHPDRLDFFRIAFGIACLLLVSKFVAYSSADIPACVWNPPGIAAWILPSPLSSSAIKTLGIGFIISLVALVIGLFSRLAAFLCGCLALALVATYHAAYYYDTSANSTIIVFFILAASPTLGRNSSIDSLFMKPTVRPESKAIWPQRLIQFLFFFIFFAAGMSKILAFNNWPAAENLIAILKWSRLHYGPAGLDPIRDPLHIYLTHSPNLVHLLGLMTIAIELSAGLFFFTNRFRFIGVILIATLNLGIILTMYFTFALIIPLYLIFVPWEKVLNFRKAIS